MKKILKKTIITLAALLVLAGCGKYEASKNEETNDTKTEIVTEEVSPSEPEAQIEEPESPFKYLTKVKKGDIVKFGDYEGNTEWLVLEKDEENQKVLLITKDVLFEGKYNEEKEKVTWETCSLRNWLNTEFYNNAFNDEERALIIYSKLLNEDHPSGHVDGGNDTEDYVFLLSYYEAKDYFTGELHADATYPDGHRTRWWLRTIAEYSYGTLLVNEEGYIMKGGGDVNSEGKGIRPAVWVDISEL